VRAARCVIAQGVPVERGVADWEVTGSHTHAWEWQAHACVASRLPRAEQAWTYACSVVQGIEASSWHEDLERTVRR
jgi:hypothetical protein